jgi:spore germination cell wall hydrolase CwlJ-like protein
MKWGDWFCSALALVLWREAQGEPYAGKLAIANVIRNRVLATHLPDQWEDVIEARWQFSSMNASWPVADEAKHGPLPDWFLKKHKNNIIVDPTLVSWPKQPDQAFEDCMAIATAVFSGAATDNTGGATHYANLGVCDPTWAHTMTKVCVIGHHTFFK